jgi:pyridoxal phosphate enzyme (YggS family)
VTVDPAAVRAGLDRVRQRIADAGADPARVQVLAVTKGFGTDAVRVAAEVGLTSVGENYAQELAGKAADLDGLDVRWHFIGRLQGNKVRQVADLVSCWQSVDRASLVDEIARRAPGARILVQVDAAGEESKGGCPPGEVRHLVERARGAGLAVEGLMAVGVFDDEARTADAFAAVRALADDLGLPERSMGMTDDLELAVRAGSTMVRVGTALFGPRPRR